MTEQQFTLLVKKYIESSLPDKKIIKSLLNNILKMLNHKQCKGEK